MEICGAHKREMQEHRGSGLRHTAFRPGSLPGRGLSRPYVAAASRHHMPSPAGERGLAPHPSCHLFPVPKGKMGGMDLRADMEPSSGLPFEGYQQVLGGFPQRHR